MDAEQSVYPEISHIHSTKVLGIHEYVKVDLVLKGCPPHRDNIVEVIKSALLNVTPRLRQHPVCVECKLKDNACLIISKSLPCMGPVTAAGCGALCPSLNRICEGCYGPMSNPNPNALAEIFRKIGYREDDIKRKFRKYAGMTPDFRKEADD